MVETVLAGRHSAAASLAIINLKLASDRICFYLFTFFMETLWDIFLEVKRRTVVEPTANNCSELQAHKRG